MYLAKNQTDMPQKPILMEQLKQILQLKADGIPIREMARHVEISRTDFLSSGT